YIMNLHYFGGVWWRRRMMSHVLSTNFRTAVLALCVGVFVGAPAMAHSTSPSAEAGQPVQRAVSGQVTDVDGNPLGGVTVTEKGTNNSTGTNEDGNFSLNISSPSSTVLVFQYLGYVTVERPISGSTVNVVLETDQMALEEVVITGFGMSQ